MREPATTAPRGSQYILSVLLVVSLTGITQAGTITIAAGDVVKTINEYARQIGVDCGYEATGIAGAGFRSNAISNETDPKIALHHLLIGSGVHAVWSHGLLGLKIDGSHKRIKAETHARPTPNAHALLQAERCTCARSIEGLPLGPWCHAEKDGQLIYAPASCGNSTGLPQK